MEGMRTGFFGRLEGFLDVFGAFGLILIVVAACVVVGIALWRGLGVMLFVLFLSFSTGAITQGGVIFLSTLTRWLFLGLLGLAFFKKHAPIKATMLFAVAYLMFGFLGVFFSPTPIWTFQQTMLLGATIFCVPVAVNSYISHPDKIGQIFKMGLVAAAVWVVVNLFSLGEFRYIAAQRYTSSRDIGAVAAAYAGAFFAPMIVWGLIQSRYKFWKYFSILLAVPFLIVLLVGAVRTAILGMVIIASLPILFSKFRPARILTVTIMVSGLLAAAVLSLFIVFPSKADVLLARLFETSTTGRTYIWAAALKLCLQDATFGQGIGSSDIQGIIKIGSGFHNAYLQIWYNTGIAGLVSILTFLTIYTLRAFRLLFRQAQPEIKEYSSIALGYLLGILAMGMYEGVFATAGGIGIVMLMIIVAIIDRLGQMSQDSIEEIPFDFDESFMIEEDLKNAPTY